MKCVNAEWEVRNLGVKTIEVEMEKEDLLEECLDKIENFRIQYDAKYVVVKSDVRRSDVSILLQNNGFVLIENQIGLSLNREDAIKALEDYKDICDNVSYRSADDLDMQMIYAELENELFKKDRISLDPHFGTKLASRRFIFWTKDDLKRGVQVFLSLYNNNPIGFFTFKQHGKTRNDAILGGIFNRPETYHQGSIWALAIRKYFVDSGASLSRTTVSSNNLEVLRLHLAFGCKITSIQNVLVKHFNAVGGLIKN